LTPASLREREQVEASQSLREVFRNWAAALRLREVPIEFRLPEGRPHAALGC